MDYILNYEPSELGPIFDHRLKKIAEEFHIIQRALSAGGSQASDRRSADDLKNNKRKRLRSIEISD